MVLETTPVEVLPPLEEVPGFVVTDLESYLFRAETHLILMSRTTRLGGLIQVILITNPVYATRTH